MALRWGKMATICSSYHRRPFAGKELMHKWWWRAALERDEQFLWPLTSETGAAEVNSQPSAPSRWGSANLKDILLSAFKKCHSQDFVIQLLTSFKMTQLSLSLWIYSLSSLIGKSLGLMKPSAMPTVSNLPKIKQFRHFNKKIKLLLKLHTNCDVTFRAHVEVLTRLLGRQNFHSCIVKAVGRVLSIAAAEQIPKKGTFYLIVLGMRWSWFTWIGWWEAHTWRWVCLLPEEKDPRRSPRQRRTEPGCGACTRWRHSWFQSS